MFIQAGLGALLGYFIGNMGAPLWLLIHKKVPHTPLFKFYRRFFGPDIVDDLVAELDRTTVAASISGLLAGALSGVLSFYISG